MTSGHILSPDTLRCVRRYVIVRKCGKKVIDFVFGNSFLDGETRTISEILQANGASLEKGKKSLFNEQEKYNLSNKAPEAFDISLLNKVSQYLWGKGVNDPGPQLRKLIRQIKNERNTVSHEEKNKLSEVELKIKLDDIQDLLKKTLLEAKSVFPSYCAEIDHLQDEIEEDCSKVVDKIREPYNPKNDGDVKRLQEEITSFGHLLYDYIQELSLGDLKSSCDGPCKILPYDWLPQCEATDPGEIAVALKLDEEKEFSLGFSPLNSCLLDQNDILQAKTKRGKDPNALIISGNAGTGKTTLLYSTAQKWRKGASNMKDLPSYRSLLYMPFRDDSYNNFDDYLRSVLPRAASLFDMKHIKPSILRSKTLILCDGFDERNANSDKLFKEMLTLSSCYNSVKIVVTTRPTNTDILTSIVNSTKLSRINLSILGLTGPNMVSLIGNVSRYLVEDETRRQEVEKELYQALEQMDEKMMDILKTPLYFNLFVLLYIQCPDLKEKVTSVTQLFVQLEEHKRRRILSKKEMSRDTLKLFEKRYEDQSLDYYINKKYEWSEEDVSKLKLDMSKVSQELEENFEYIMSAYFNVKHETKGLNIERVFCLRHRSEQEFVVARIISEEIINSFRRQERNLVQRVLSSINFQRRGNLVRRVLSSKGIPADPVILVFIAGILYHSNRQIFEESVVELFEIMSQFMFKDKDDFCHIDPMLAIYAEVNGDQNSLESLVEVLRKKSSNQRHEINEALSLKSLNSLLPRLSESQRLFIGISEYLGKKLTILLKTLNANAAFWIKTGINIKMRLEDLHLAEPAGQEVITLDYVWLTIGDKGGPLSLSQIPAFPVRGKIMVVHYVSEREDFRETCQALNNLLPSRGNAAEASPSSSKDTSPQRSIILVIFVNHCTPDEIKTGLESLTIQPSQKILIRTLREEDKTDFLPHRPELEEICRRQELGILNFVTLEEWNELSDAEQMELFWPCNEDEKL